MKYSAPRLMPFAENLMPCYCTNGSAATGVHASGLTHCNTGVAADTTWNVCNAGGSPTLTVCGDGAGNMTTSVDFCSTGTTVSTSGTNCDSGGSVST